MDGPLRFESLPKGSSVNGGKLLELNAVKSTGPARCDKHARRTEWRKRHLPEGDARLRGKGHQQRERQAERDAGRTGLRTPRRRRSRELPRPRGTPSLALTHGFYPRGRSGDAVATHRQPCAARKGTSPDRLSFSRNSTS